MRDARIPHKRTYVHVLEAFESGLDSWFRYPCALTVEESKEQGHLYHHLWDGYGKLMHAYGKKLTTLLNKGWKGPHRWSGNWTFQGEFLGYVAPFATASRRR
jgi:hypothetical protein